MSLPMRFSNRLLNWYDRHARQLPWRVSPTDGKAGILPDPYHVWLSEVMLQQTTVATVKPYYKKFLARWPTVSHLAAASIDDVMAAWAGLGYYSRARNLKACADIVASDFDGNFPRSSRQLLELPGIGEYTSAAIAAIAFGERVAVVDGNIERVLARQMADSTPPPKLKANCASLMDRETPRDRPGDFSQAMMDLGATICTPRNPVCGLCPVARGCVAKQTETMPDFPAKVIKKAKPARKGAVFVAAQNDGTIWLVRRPEKGLLGGMAALPTTDWNSRQDGATEVSAAPFDGDWQRIGSIHHTFTHFHLELQVLCATGVKPVGDGWWGDTDALPTVFRKAAIAALASQCTQTSGIQQNAGN